MTGKKNVTNERFVQDHMSHKIIRPIPPPKLPPSEKSEGDNKGKD